MIRHIGIKQTRDIGLGDGWWMAHVGDGLICIMVDQDLDALAMAIGRCHM